MLNVAFFSGPEPDRIESCLADIEDVSSVTVALVRGLAPALRRRLRGGMSPQLVLLGGGIPPEELPEAIHVLRAEAPRRPVVVVVQAPDGRPALEGVPKEALNAIITSDQVERLPGILRYAAHPRVRERMQQRDFAFFEVRQPVGGVYVKDASLRYLYVDTTYAARLGQEPDALLGQTDREFMSEADLEETAAEERRVIGSGEAVERVESITLEGGDSVEARLIRAPIYDNDGQIRGVLSRWDRVDELGEQATRPSDELRLTLGPGGVMLNWPPEAERLFRYAAAEALGRPLGFLASPVERAHLARSLRAAFAGGQAEAGNLTVVRSDGMWMRMEVSLHTSPHPDAGSRSLRARCSTTLWPSVAPSYPPGFESPEHLLDPMPDLTYRLNLRSGRFDYISPWVDCLLGYSHHELAQMGIKGAEQRLRPADRKRAREATRRLLADRAADSPVRLEYSFRAKDGSRIALVEDRYVPRGRDGRPQAQVGAIRQQAAQRGAASVLRVSDTAQSLPRLALESLTLKDLELNVVWAWDVGHPVYGLAPERLVGLSDFDLVPPETARAWRAEDRAFLANVEEVPFQICAMLYRAPGMDAREQRKIGVFDAQGRPAGLLVTRTRVKRQDLDALSAYWTAVAVSTPDAMIGLDHAGRVVAWNPGAESLYGYSAEQIRGRVLDFVWTDPDRDVWSYLGRLAAGDSIRGEETVHRAADGRCFPVSLSMSPVRAQEEVVMGYAIVARDITEKREAQQSLQRSEERLRRLVETVSDGISICEWDAAGGKLSLWLCNDRYVEMSGYSQQELKQADDLWELRTSLESEQQQQSNLERLKEGLPCTGTASWKRPDGKENYIEWSAVALEEQERLTVYFVERDVTERQRREQSLRRSQDRFRIAAQIAFEGISIARWDPMRDIRKLVFCNDRFIQMSGYTRTELEQASDLGQLHSFHEDAAEAQRRYAHFISGRRYGGRASWDRPDGKFNVLEFRAVCRKVGDRYHLLSVERDITEQARRAEEPGG